MDMDVIFHIHGNPGYTLTRHCWARPRSTRPASIDGPFAYLFVSIIRLSSRRHSDHTKSTYNQSTAGLQYRFIVQTHWVEDGRGEFRFRRMSTLQNVQTIFEPPMFVVSVDF